MSEHTPGPWIVEEYGDDDFPSLVVHSDENNRICFMATPGSRGNNKQIAANAYLIAAAPEMLSALKNLNSIESKTEGECVAAWEQVAAAVAKAEGTKT